MSSSQDQERFTAPDQALYKQHDEVAMKEQPRKRARHVTYRPQRRMARDHRSETKIAAAKAYQVGYNEQIQCGVREGDPVMIERNRIKDESRDISILRADKWAMRWSKFEVDALLASLAAAEADEWEMVRYSYANAVFGKASYRRRTVVELKAKAKELRCEYLDRGQELPVGLDWVTALWPKQGFRGSLSDLRDKKRGSAVTEQDDDEALSEEEKADDEPVRPVEDPFAGQGGMPVPAPGRKMVQTKRGVWTVKE